MKKRQKTISIVTPDQAMKLAEPIIKVSPDKLTLRVLLAEPAVFGLAALVAKDTCRHLAKRGVSEALRAYVFNQICYAGALSISVMREAHLKDQKGKKHGKK
jgi:hypothetical protein